MHTRKEEPMADTTPLYNSIRPGQVWLDTKGKRIQAHGGSVMYLDGYYYFYGENKEKPTGKSILALILIFVAVLLINL